MTAPVTANGSTGVQQAVGSFQDWQIDPRASRIEFTIGKRLMFVKKLRVTGRFAEVSGTIALDEQQPSGSSATVTIGAASIDTGNARRDKHLRAADFFDVARYPQITFASRRVELIDATLSRYRVTGDLTVHGVTRVVALEGHYVAPQSGAGERRISISLSGTLQRKDFGLLWSKPIIRIAEDLTVSLTVEATRA